jgi:peroxiredoxin
VLISDLYIIHESGLCYYHYQSPFSTSYEFNQDLFGGFIAALSAFTKPLSNKAIDFLKMQNEQLHFVVFDHIIVVSLVNELEDIDQEAIIQLLSYAGDKFLEKYGDQIDKAVEWDLLKDEFTEEISFLIDKDAVIEEMRRERISNLVNDVISGKITPVNLVNSISKLYSNAEWQEISKAKETIDNISNILPTLKYDIFLEARISNALKKTISHLQWLAKLKLPMSQIFVLCEDDSVFEGLFNLFISHNSIPVHFKSIQSLISAIENNTAWNEGMSYNILILSGDNIKTKELNKLIKLVNKNIYLYLDLEEGTVLKSILEEVSSLVYKKRDCEISETCEYCQDFLESIYKTELDNLMNQVKKENEIVVKG